MRKQLHLYMADELHTAIHKAADAEGIAAAEWLRRTLAKEFAKSKRQYERLAHYEDGRGKWKRS